LADIRDEFVDFLSFVDNNFYYYPSNEIRINYKIDRMSDKITTISDRYEELVKEFEELIEGIDIENSNIS